MQTYEYILISLSIGQFLAMIVGGYIFLQKPSVIAKKIADDARDDLENQKTACQYKHKRIDEIFAEINGAITRIDKSITLIKENDLKHIETEMRRMNDIQIKILTIMELSKEK